ncbi:uncharacterized protein LOC124852617 isoform X2 [Hippoglossus stenolepis]|uniref:uncharacterized protein LOC124852617 isoform X2 n=1 Tax=Hippoglossus stenolepis TaxID=195615 RepID=UPI001FAF9F7C|nr:uncharacterized protein LOC124852617 isoform X2 [Hippoglossus stenolepis]
MDDEMGFVTTETQSTEVVDLAGSSSGETENSSDFGDELYIDEEKETTGNQVQRHVHNMLERRRRVKMMQMFRGLSREVGLRDNRTSKISTLKKNKRATKRIMSELIDVEEQLLFKGLQRRKETSPVFVPSTKFKNGDATKRTNHSSCGGAGDPGAEVDRSTSEREEEEADEEEGPLPLNHRSNRSLV